MATGDELKNRVIEDQQTEGEIQKEVLLTLDESQKILKYFQEQKGLYSDEFKSMQKEYDDVRSSTLNSLQDLKGITGQELGNIKKELADMTSEYADARVEQGHNIEQILSEEEALKSLKESNDSFKDSWLPAKVIYLKQEQYIATVLGEGHEGYNTKYVQGFNSKTVGNYLIEISELEEKLGSEDPNDWNSKAVENYFKMLAATGNMTLAKVIGVMGAQNIVRLKEVWSEENEETPKYAKESLLGDPKTKWIVEGIETLNTDELMNSDGKTIEETCKVLDANPEAETTRQKVINSAKQNRVGYVEETKGRDVTNCTETFKEATVETRKDDFGERVGEKGQEMLDGLKERFQNNTEILSLIENALNYDPENPFDIDTLIGEINQKIEAHNKKPENKEKQIAVLEKNNWANFFEGILEIRSANLQIEYTKTLDTLENLGKTFQSLQERLTVEQQELVRLKAEQKRKQEEAARLRAQGDKQAAEAIEAEVQKATDAISQRENDIASIQGDVEETQEALMQETGKLEEIVEAQQETDTVKAINDALQENPEIIKNTESYAEARQKALALPEVQAQVQKVEEFYAPRQENVSQTKIFVESGEIEKALPLITKLKKEDDTFYATAEYEIVLKNLDDSYTSTMKSAYGDEWQEGETRNISSQNPVGGDESLSYDLQPKIISFEGKPAIENYTGTPIPITPEEAKIAEENPEALQNMVNFHQFFADLNLEGVWEYREELVTTMGSLNINLKDNSLDPQELVAFGNRFVLILNAFLKKEGEEELHGNHQSIFSLKAELRRFSQSGNFMSQEKTFNTLGEDKFTALMRKYGIIGGVMFHTNALRDGMNGKFTTL